MKALNWNPVITFDYPTHDAKFGKFRNQKSPKSRQSRIQDFEPHTKNLQIDFFQTPFDVFRSVIIVENRPTQNIF